MQNVSDLRPQLLKEGLWTGGNFDLFGFLKFEPGARLYRQVRVINSHIGAYSYINANSAITNVKIGRYCSIASDVLIGLDRHPTDWVSTSPFPFDNVGYPTEWKRFQPTHRFYGGASLTTIEDDCWVGARVIVAGSEPITIGRGSIVAAGSVVTNSIPPFSIVGGSPAKIIRPRFDFEIATKIQETGWWNYDFYRYTAEGGNEVVPFDKPD